MDPCVLPGVRIGLLQPVLVVSVSNEDRTREMLSRRRKRLKRTNGSHSYRQLSYRRAFHMTVIVHRDSSLHVTLVLYNLWSVGTCKTY